MAKPDNDWYLNGLKRNDPEVIRTIMRNCGHSLAGWVKKNSGSLVEAEDVVNHAMMEIYLEYIEGRLVLTGSFCSYFFSIGKNYWLNQLRRKKIHQRVTSGSLVLYEKREDDPFTALMKAEKYQLIQDCFAQLDDNCKELLTQLWNSPKNIKEFCKSLGKNYTNIRKKKSRCERKLIELIRTDNRFGELFDDEY